jgi:cell wall-associated NlpC family hydrolase
MRVRIPIFGCLLVVLLSSCKQGAGDVVPRAEVGDTPQLCDSDARVEPQDEATSECPERLPAPTPLPGITAEQRTAAYWIERAKAYGNPDAPILTAQEIDDHDRAMRLPDSEGPLGWTDLLAPTEPGQLQGDIAARLRNVREDMAAGTYVDRNGSRFPEDAVAELEPPDHPPALRDEWRVALAPLPIRCGPRSAGLYTVPVDLAFDRNNCGSARPQELLRVLADWSGGWKVVRTASAFGWIPDDAPLSPPVPEERRATMAQGPRVRIAGAAALRSDDGATADVPEGTIVPLVENATDRVWFADAAGLHESATVLATLHPTRRDLTRRAFLEEAFARLDAAYGWGGQDGGLDCSGFVQEVFASFDLELPRHSSRQALAGTFSLDVSPVADPAEKVRLLESAAQRGVVILQFTGHIMLYLGLAADGTPMAIHSFSEYLVPCGGANPDGTPRETHVRADRVDVSDLTLGAGSSKGSFLERLERITVVGRSPGEELAGVAQVRPPAPVDVPEGDACSDSLDVAIFRSPRVPNAQQPLRVIVTTAKELGPVELVLVGPGGERPALATHRLGGPPWTWWVEVEQPAAGDWTAVLGDGTSVAACEEFHVARFPSRPPAHGADEPPWRSIWRWERDTDNLYAAFVEQLFLNPGAADATWPDLQTLLRDPQRNLLHDHLGLGEDEKLLLVPDCADLPYFLRAYFAWKFRLPFAFRRCTRGHAGIPPSCTERPLSNLDPWGPAAIATAAVPAEEAEPAPVEAGETPAEPRDELEVFQAFITRVANSVHSATARTVPSAEASDLYPVALTRESLPPGTVYADPYGHTLVVAAWIPQGLERYGALVAADAQPDGTVGLRRFWRGTFLFSPETADVGAGFKAWRPAEYDRAAEAIVTPDNEALRRTNEHPRWNDQQYAGTADDFYDSVEALINPRPLEPEEALDSLVDALEEAAVRRVLSVRNGEDYVRAHPDQTIAMPEGYEIFETEGAWEDFATPSRDMRLLIAIDTVLGFPDAVARAPERYGVVPDEVDAVVAGLRTALGRTLADRGFEYVRSDGATQRLTPQDVVDRREGFETAFNPNDCVEIRWAAPEGSNEAGSCARRAPTEQLARMEQIRAWFHDHRRPPR